MPKISEAVDNLTRTFSADRAYCEALLQSADAVTVAELLISHQWANSGLPVCYRTLEVAIPAHFGERSEAGRFWNLVLLDSVNRDLRLVPYLVLRGLASDASAALRRALEHVGVLTHIWASPAKLAVLRDVESSEYSRAFRREVDKVKADALRVAKKSKRFAEMNFAAVATLLYDALSTLDIHGGTASRFMSAEAHGRFVCSFIDRPEPVTATGTRRLNLLLDGHRAICGEILSLCADYAKPSDELRQIAETFTVLAPRSDEVPPELRRLVDDLLSRLGVNDGAENIH